MKKIKRPRYVDALKDRVGNGMVKIITGVRRSGKSYLLFELFYSFLLESGVERDSIIAISLDDEASLALRDPQKLWNHIIDKISDEHRQYYIFLDEIQYAISDDELKRAKLSGAPLRIYDVLNGLLHKKNVDVYVTGSNSRFLSSDVMTEFRGRGDEIHVLPFSFSEFVQAYDGDVYRAWGDYVMYGGLPLVPTFKTAEQKALYLKRLFEETYLKDIVARNRIKKSVELGDLVDILASATGSLTNPYKIQQTFKSAYHSTVSASTISGYIDCLREAFVLNCANRYDVKGRKYIGSPSKFYFEDVGLRNARLNFRQVEENHIMENIIYNELRYRGFCVDVGVVEKQVREEGKPRRVYYEIDFVANKASERYYIQSAFEMGDKAKREQETKSLRNTGDDFRKIIVQRSFLAPHYDENGILVMGIFDFLTKEEWKI